MKKKKGLRLTVVLALICSILVTAMPLASFAADDISTTQTAPATRTYKVRHVRQSLDGSYNDESLAEYETLTGNVGDKTEAKASKSYEGFQALVPEQVQIAASGDITVTVYYARKSYTTYFKTADPTKDFSQTNRYEESQSAPPALDINGNMFMYWEYVDENGVTKNWQPGLQPAKDMTVYAKYDVPTQASYTINYWYQNATDEVSYTDDEKTYSLFDTEKKVQDINTVPNFDATTRETTYKKFNADKTRIANANKLVNADGSTVINVYYDRPVMTITLVYYNTDTGVEDHRVDLKGLYGHSTEETGGLDPKYRWSAAGSASNGRRQMPAIFTILPLFMIDDYHIEFHARILAPPSNSEIYVVFHYQNTDGTWTRDMKSKKLQSSTYDFLNFSTYFTSNVAHNYAYYYWTNAEDEFTTDVGPSNSELKPYTSGQKIQTLQNGKIVGDYDNDGVGYMHVYVELRQYDLRFENAGNPPVKLYYGEALSSANAEINNPIKPANIPAEYVFDGWYTSPGLQDGTEYDPEMKMGTQDKFLYAKWVQPRVKVTVEGNGANSELPSVIDVPMLGSVHRDLSMIPSKDGNWFAGWFRDAAFTQPFDVNESLTQDITVYAKWVGRQQANWEIRYVDEDGNPLADSKNGFDNLYAVLYTSALNIPGYAVDFANKNLSLLSADDVNTVTFVYSKQKPAETIEAPKTAKSNVPNTGDSSNAALYGAVMAMSALALAALAIAKRKHS